MTTLPQTTNPRLPQGSSPPAGIVYAAGPSPAPAGGAMLSGADVWRIIRANLWLLVILVLIGGASGYGLHVLWVQNWPQYTATGLLQIRTEILKDPVKESADDMSDTRLATVLRTQQSLLQFPQLFSTVLSQPFNKIREETEWFKGFKSVQDAREDLESHFRVTILPDSALLNVRMTCRNPRDASIIVDEIVKQHLKDENKKAGDALTARTSSLRMLKTEQDRQIKDVTDKIRNLQETIAASGGGVEGLFSAKEAQLQALVQGELKLSGDWQEADTAAKRAKEQIEKGDTPPDVQKMIDFDPQALSLSRALADFQIQRDAKAETLGKEHKDVLLVTRIAELYKQKLEDRQKELKLNYSNQYLIGLQGAEQIKKAQLADVRSQIENLKKEHIGISKLWAELALAKDTQKDLNTARQQTENILSTITATSGTDSPGRIGWPGPPEIPQIPSWPKLWIMLPAGILVGLMLGLGIAFLREMMDDTVRSPRDISRVGQLNLLGMIADEDDDPAVANAKLPIFDAPHSMTAEQFRQVRTRLAHATALETTRSIMVTGPSPLDGKTTVAANLAAGLALNGRKILLVDANFRRPEIHRLFGFPNDKGFSDVLNGTSGLDDCVHATRIPNLSVLTSGPKPPNATELFESQLLADFIEKALEEFDHVIFDTGPFLVVSESVAMAPRVDGVVTVVRAHEERRGTLQRMRDSLRQVKAEHIGIVLNAVRAQGGGYYGRNIKTYYTYNNGG